MANPTIQGAIADALVAYYNADSTAIEAIIAKGEGELQTFIVDVLQSVKIGGIIGVIFNAVEGSAESVAAQIIAKYTPAEIYALIGALLTAEAKNLGG
jgi:hypothetical protein